MDTIIQKTFLTEVVFEVSFFIAWASKMAQCQSNAESFDSTTLAVAAG